MNNWWLKLYTIPHIKKHAINIGIVCILNVLSGLLLKGHTWTLILFIYPVYSFITSSPDSLVSNIEFHKLSVPYPKLLKAAFLDQTIEIACFLSLFIIGLGIPLSIREISHELFGFLKWWFIGTPAFTILAFVGFTAFIFSVRFTKLINQNLTEVKKMTLLQVSEAKVQRKIATTVLFLASVVAGAILAQKIRIPALIDSLNPILITCTMFIFFSVFGLVMFIRHKFHFDPTMTTQKQFGKILAACAGSVFIFVLSLGVIARFEFNSSFFSVASRVKTLHFFDDFSPELEVDTVAEMLKHDPGAAEYIWKHAAEESWQLPITQMYEKNDLYVWYWYLEYRKPSDQNLVYMLRELENNKEANKWYSAHNYRLVRTKLVSYLPDASKLPPDLLKVEKVSKKRLPASDKKDPGP